MRRIRIEPQILLIVLLGLFAWAPLLNDLFFFKAHDAPHSVFFLLEFDQAFRDGAWYPRWGTDFALGYGYPLFNVYAPLAFYAAEAFVLAGISYVGAVKIVFALGFVLSGLTMYLFAGRLFGKTGGTVAAVVYMVIPYHVLDIYVRSAFAESFAFAFMPLVLWAFHRLIVEAPGDRGELARRIAIAGLSLAGLVMAHNGVAFVFLPFFLAYVGFLLVYHFGKNLGALILKTVQIGMAGALSLGLSAVFWLPMVAEAKYLQVEQWTSASYNFQKHFIYLFQFFSPFWGYEYSGEGIKDGMPFQFGLVAVLLAVVGAVVILRKNAGKENRYITGFFLVSTIAVAYSMLGESAFWWNLIPAAALVQFPWRLLSVIAVSLSALAGAAVVGLNYQRDNTDLSRQFYGIAPLLVVVLLGSLSYLTPQYTPVEPVRSTARAIIEFETFSPEDRVGATSLVTQRPKTSPLVAQYLADQPLQKAIATSAVAKVTTIKHGGSSETVSVDSPAPTELMFYTYVFPGWTAYVDGKNTEIYPTTDQALITLRIPAGQHNVSLRFEDTPVRAAGNVATVVSLLLSFVLILAGKLAFPRKGTKTETAKA